jgi:hypothetical protein
MEHAAWLIAAIAVLPAFVLATWVRLDLARADEELGLLASTGGLPFKT